VTTRIGLLLAVGLLLAACGSSSAAWTPLPSGAEPPASCARADAAGVIAISADQLKFSAPCIVAPADKPFVVRFTNKETQPHDVAIYDGPDKKTKYLEGEVFSGPGLTKDYAVSPLPAGEYYFDCVIHAEMKGAFYVR
jgi:plastocyanin